MLEPLEDRALLSLTTWTVNSLGDTGTGSGTSGDLRYCITQADQTPGDNTINFSVTGPITLYSPLPDLSNTTGVTDIEGPGATSLTVARSSASETPDFSLFTVDAAVQAKIVGLTITGGVGESGADGGGIDNSGTLTVMGTTIAYNVAMSDFNSGGNGGGIYNAGTLTVTNSTIDHNVAYENGGGIDNTGTLSVTDSIIANNNEGTASAGDGGGIDNENTGTLTVTNSTVDDNRAYLSGGGISNAGTLSVTNSTIANNIVGLEFGGGISNTGKLTITNSTVAYNNSPAFLGPGQVLGGGGGIINDGGTLTATNSTIAYNSTNGTGGGLLNLGTATLDNTLVALNTSNSLYFESNISGVVSSSSAYNLIGSNGFGGLVNGVNGNQVGVANPGLGPLAYYGGPTQTIALLPGSPAIDAGSNALAVDPSTGQPLTTDQRGPGFLRILNGTVDIGAYEYLPAANDTVAVTWGTQTALLQTASDGLRLLPQGRTTDLPWLGIYSLQVTLSQAQTLTATDVTVNSANGVNYGPVTVSGSGTSYTITLAQPINAADRVTITIVNPGVSIFNRRLDVLPGDVNDDGVVNVQDMVAIRNQMLGLVGAVPTIFGDINGDGKVDINDYTAVRELIGTTLPSIT